MMPIRIQKYDPAFGRVPRATRRMAIAKHPVRTEAYILVRRGDDDEVNEVI